MVTQRVQQRRRYGYQQRRIRKSCFPVWLKSLFPRLIGFLSGHPVVCSLRNRQAMTSFPPVAYLCPLPLGFSQQTKPAGLWDRPLHARAAWLPKSKAIGDQVAARPPHHHVRLHYLPSAKLFRSNWPLRTRGAKSLVTPTSPRLVGSTPYSTNR